MDIFTRDEAYAVYEDAVRREPSFPEGFVERLRGKTIREQVAMFAVVEKDTYRSYSYGEEDGGWDHTKTMPVEELKQFRGVIVENGLVEGIMVKNDHGKVVPLGPNEAESTYYASDDDGTGGSYRSVYVRLVCLPADGEQA